MFKRIGTAALRCKHGRLIGVEHCKDCWSHQSEAPMSGVRRLYNTRQAEVASPLQRIGMAIQRAFHQMVIPLAPKFSLYPVWAGTMEDINRGKMVFGLSTGTMREDYEDPPLQLVVTMKIKYTTPWWLRLWRRVTGWRPKRWEQQPGFHFRADKDGKVRRIDDPSKAFVPGVIKCPQCGGSHIENYSSLEQEFAGVNEFACSDCSHTWTDEVKAG